MCSIGDQAPEAVRRTQVCGRDQLAASLADASDLDVIIIGARVAGHTSIHNHFDHDRHLICRDIFNQNGAGLAEWHQLAA
jgi:hypothetical protein